jgi:hypothetical protein
MDAKTGEQAPPDSTDYAGWRQAVADGRFRQFPLETIVAAIQDLRTNTDSGVRNALVKFLSDTIYTRLRRTVGTNHPNSGKDIIDRVHFMLFEAVARPNSADGKGLREAFASRLMFRLKDAIAIEARAGRIPDQDIVKKKHEDAGKTTEKKNKTEPLANEDEGEAELVGLDECQDLVEEAEPLDAEEMTPSNVQLDPTMMDGVRDLDQQIDVNRFLEENISDDRKRLAFRLFMDDFPYKSKRSASICEFRFIPAGRYDTKPDGVTI